MLNLVGGILARSNRESSSHGGHPLLGLLSLGWFQPRDIGGVEQFHLGS